MGNALDSTKMRHVGAMNIRPVAKRQGVPLSSVEQHLNPNVTFRQVRRRANGSLRAAGLPSVGSATRALYDDVVAKKNRAVCPALRTGAHRLRATLLPFALPSLVAERAQRDEAARCNRRAR
jgi:hypothetical protein